MSGQQKEGKVLRRVSRGARAVNAPWRGPSRNPKHPAQDASQLPWHQQLGGGGLASRSCPTWGRVGQPVRILDGIPVSGHTPGRPALPGWQTFSVQNVPLERTTAGGRSKAQPGGAGAGRPLLKEERQAGRGWFDPAGAPTRSAQARTATP